MAMRKYLSSPLFVALMAALLGLLSEFAHIVDHGYWKFWYRLEQRNAPRQFAIISLDNGSATKSASTADQAAVVDTLLKAGVEQVYLDIPVDPAIDHRGDAKLREVIAKGGSRVVMVARAETDAIKGVGQFPKSDFVLPTGAIVAASAWHVDFVGYFQRTAARVDLHGRPVPAVAALTAMRTVTSGEMVYPSFGFNPETIQTHWSESLLADRVEVSSLRGRSVFVTRTNPELGTAVGFFGHDFVSSAVADIAGIYGEMRGPALALGSFPLLLVFGGMILVARRLRRAYLRYSFYAGFVVLAMFLPRYLADLRVLTSPDLATVALLAYAPARLWQKWRERLAMTSSASGLPNIDALAVSGIAGSHDVVAASISHYEQMLASLPRELHGECARQIARRLSIASGDSQIYDTDKGQFVWLTQPYSTDALVAQLEGLKALFAAPLMIAGHVLDTNIHFGLDRNADSMPMSRIRSAIVSSSEAQAKGKLYEEFGSKRLAETQWELSLHARIDDALRNGHIWLAYQSQYDFGANAVRSAETLIRWTDPERGAIPPDSFILQAERAGRIDALTYWVLDQAIVASKALNRDFGAIQLSVNLSAWMVDQPTLVQQVTDIVRKHAFDCSRLTFEVTETFSMSNREIAKRNLAALRTMGFHLSIDDFGTGQSGLAYLAEIPSDELKLDRRFIQAVLTSNRDRTIVSNTVQLAHALGQRVVAEGVEDFKTFEALRGLGCDIAQGYFIGRPMPFADFVAELRNQQTAAGNVVNAC